MNDLVLFLEFKWGLFEIVKLKIVKIFLFLEFILYVDFRNIIVIVVLIFW